MEAQEAERSEEIARSVVRKIMLRLAPFLAILYVFNQIDRGNVAIAALTMKKDLNFTDAAYGIGTGMFFVGYLIFEVPSNLIMERVGARRWIARIMISWGLVSASMLFVWNVYSFSALRILLGVAEAGFYPGILLYLTYWTPTRLRAQVIARFLALQALLGLFGPPLGGYLLTHGLFGMKGWQWLFLVEGVPSILLGFVVLALLPDTPAEVNWLSIEEKSWIASSLAQDAANDQRVHHLSWRVALSEPRILQLCLVFFITAVAGNMVGYFGPQLIKDRSSGLWSDQAVATVGVIPAAIGAFAMMIAATHSDRTEKRKHHIVIGYSVAALGYLLCVFAPNASGVVAAFALNALGERIGAGSYWALTTNLMGTRAAAGGIAFINSVGNFGGFFGPALMGELKTRMHGGYTAGLCVAAGLMAFAAILSLFLNRHPSSQPGSNTV